MIKKYNKFILGFISGVACFLLMGQTQNTSSRYLDSNEVGRYQAFGTDFTNRFLIDTQTGEMFWYDHRTNKGWIYEKNSNTLFNEKD